MRRILLAALLLLSATPAAAQAPGFSTGEWLRLETENFLFIYPEEASEWTLAMAERMEAVRTAVHALVGFVPGERVTVLVDDPSNVSNGSMNPGPLLFMWPTPPTPRSVIGEHRGWGELLAVHELAHAAHLTRPSRNPVERLRWSLLPVPTTHMMVRTPRWVIEGYATYVEGRLTGHGRPHGLWRPAILRTWALEGRLPTYGQLSGTSGYFGSAMAYLAGSAYLEWLVEREGGSEELLPNVWARFTARQTRSFDAAFAGVFGAPTAELYGHFAVELTRQALAVRDAIAAEGGVVEGELFQRLSWSTGDPAVSPDGERLAVVLRSEDAPSRVVVMSTTPDTLPTSVRERQERIFERDPEDVPPVQRRPRAQRAQATLWPTGGAPYDAPRWMPDGEGILLVRSDFVENGQSRGDLYLWRWESGGVRRITRGEAIREADPSPDGGWAAGLRCLNARCDVVRIDLTSGEVTTIAAGDPLSPWYRPRISPDGRTIVASRQIDGNWHLVSMSSDGSEMRFAGPQDGASRFDAAFLPGDPERLVVTSTRGGVHNLELLELESGTARPLTRVEGAAVAPVPAPSGEVYFLSLHSRGWDLRRIALDDGSPARVDISPFLAPAAAVGPVQADTFEVAEIGAPRRYGAGPRFHSFAPMGSFAPGAEAWGAMLHGTDPIGILSWQLRGLFGDAGALPGGALDVVWRGLAPAAVRLGGFATRGHGAPTGLPGVPGEVAPVPDRYDGGLLTVGGSRLRVGSAQRFAIGGSLGRAPGDQTRSLGWFEAETAHLRTPGRRRIESALGLHASVGRTGDEDWTRWLGSGSLSIGQRNRALELSGSYGRTTAQNAWERFTVGGIEPLLLDGALLAQRIAMPALPAGLLRGDEAWTARLDLRNGSTRLFYWTGDARESWWERQQLVGVEMRESLPAMPHIRLPSVHVQAGAARLLEPPLENEWRGWVVVGFRP